MEAGIVDQPDPVQAVAVAALLLARGDHPITWPTCRW